jgi:hypothetical protein
MGYILKSIFKPRPFFSSSFLSSGAALRSWYRLSTVVAALTTLLVGACAGPAPTMSDPASPGLEMTSELGSGIITPMCVLGCQDPDPDPDAPGYFFPGYENQWEHCSDPAVDQDGDGLDDWCEYRLAHAFRPEMSFVYFDNSNHEGRWAAEWANGDLGSMTVRIAYLHGYWLDIGDGGTSGTVCDMFGSSKCDGHLGDSEWIRLDISYDSTSKHWYLADAKYSAHTWHVDFNRSKSGWLYVSPSSDGGGNHLPRNFMEYPDGVIGGYPRAYAADGKHANYPTVDYCNGPGGWNAADDCDGPRLTQRFNVTTSNNIGSRTQPFINCVTTQRSDHPDYSSGHSQCYWNNSQRFTGWFAPNPNQGDSEPYGQILADHFGF